MVSVPSCFGPGVRQGIMEGAYSRELLTSWPESTKQEDGVPQFFPSRLYLLKALPPPDFSKVKTKPDHKPVDPHPSRT